jgi:hypothetical protein
VSARPGTVRSMVAAWLRRWDIALRKRLASFLAAVALALTLAACGEYRPACLASGDPDCQEVASLASTFPNGPKRDVLSVEPAACAEMNITDEIRPGIMVRCWKVTLTDPEVEVREIVVFRMPDGELAAELCLSPNCDDSES